MHDGDFEDIRPYRDHEFKKVAHRIAGHPWILSGLRKLMLPNTPAIFTKPVDLFLEQAIRFKLAPIKTIDDFHTRIIRKTVLVWAVDRTTAGVTFSGEENIFRDRSILYMTNHRDIVLDSSFLCMILMDLKMRTPEIAFGSNLLLNELTSDLIRINKSFLVKRNLPIREQITEALKLSRYIYYTLGKNNSIWLAQREGRAKDGNDRTNPSVIKMLYLSQRKGGMEFSDFINHLNLMPVAISYEYDPCDEMKAYELWKVQRDGVYQKRAKEDLVSIIKGMKGWKGRIHYAFAPVLKGEWRDAQHVAEAIDAAIHREYKLWPTNYIAYDQLAEKPRYCDHYSKEEQDAFLSRFSTLSEQVKRVALETYARPVINHENVSD